MASATISVPGVTEDASIDPYAGGTYRGKTIYTLDQIEANLNRTGYNWYLNNYGELNDGVLNYGFWRNPEELLNSYYVNTDGTIAFDEAYYIEDFSPFSAGQQQLARESIALWNDLIAIDFKETKSYEADIALGNTNTGSASQAYAYLPFGNIYDAFYSQAYGFEDTGKLSGDVWINNTIASNFNPLTSSYYAKTTMIHELGHSLGLSHPGDYNAGQGGAITYKDSAFFAQDSRQYSIMSYFDAYETGAQHIDFTLLNFAYSSTPMVHDVAAIQAIYGADTTTRTGNTVYGFNSTADRSEFDFTVNTRPIVTIYDAGGKDTLDFSGFKTPTIMNLNEGSFSSGGGVIKFPTLEEVNANRAALGFAPRTQAAFDFYENLKAELGITNGLFKDNISIAYGTIIENAVGGSSDDYIIANQVKNIISGRNGNDTVSYETATSGVQIKLGGEAGTGGAAGDKLRFVENLTGSKYGDLLIGDVGNNVLNGGFSVNGSQDNDTLRGLGGRDTFMFQITNTTGLDIIRDFSTDDFIATDKKIYNPIGDGFIALGANNEILLDETDGDKVRLTGVTEGLKFIGETKGLYYYALQSSTATMTDVNALHKPNFGREPLNQAGASNLAASDSPLFTDVDNTTQDRDANYVNPYGIGQSLTADENDDHVLDLRSGGSTDAGLSSVAASAFVADDHAAAVRVSHFDLVMVQPVAPLDMGMVHFA